MKWKTAICQRCGTQSNLKHILWIAACVLLVPTLSDCQTTDPLRVAGTRRNPAGQLDTVGWMAPGFYGNPNVKRDFLFPEPQTIRPTYVSQLRYTSITTAQEAGMTFQDGDTWYNSDLKCWRLRLNGVSQCGPQPAAGDPWYDVRTCGAIGDGSTDDTTAIQACINLARVGGGIVYFPCGKTFKFGALDLSVAVSPSGWVRMQFCGRPKPTATITMNRSNYSIEGVAAQGTQNFFEKLPSTGFDLSALPGTTPPITITSSTANPVLVKAITMTACLGTCILIEAGPVDVTLDTVNLSVADSSTSPVLETSVGFNLFIMDSTFNGSLTNAQPNILSHGTGMLNIQRTFFGRRGIKIVKSGAAGNLSASNLRDILVENLIPDAFIEIDSTDTASCEDIWIGPNVKLADNFGAGGKYLIQKSAGSQGCKVNLVGVNAFSGFATTMTNGFGASDQVIIYGDSCSNIGATAFTCYARDFVTSSGSRSAFGSTVGISNVPLAAFQTQNANPGLVVREISGGGITDIISHQDSAGNKQMGFFIDNGTPTHGLRWWNNAGTFKADMRFGGTGPAADRLFTLPDVTGHIPALPTSATTQTGTGDIVRATSPTLITPILGVATGTSFQGIIGNVTPAAGTFTTLTSTGLTTAQRFKANGTALVAGDFALDANWGAGAAVSAVTGTDQAWQITVTAAGVPALNAGVTLTFKDGTWTTAPICQSQVIGGTGAVADMTGLPTATTWPLVYTAVPVAASTYIITGMCFGRP